MGRGTEHLVLTIRVHQFTYINAAFAPAPDDTVGSLYKSFGTEGHLIVNYRCGRTQSSHILMC